MPDGGPRRSEHAVHGITRVIRDRRQEAQRVEGAGSVACRRPMDHSQPGEDEHLNHMFVFRQERRLHINAAWKISVNPRYLALSRNVFRRILNIYIYI